MLLNLPIFFRLLKQNILLYSVFSTNSVDVAFFEDYDYLRTSKEGFHVYNFSLSDSEQFDDLFIFILEGNVMCDLKVSDDRFLINTKSYFGKDSYLRDEVIQEGPMAGMSKLKSKKLYFYDLDPSISVWIRSSPMYGNVVTIEHIDPDHPVPLAHQSDTKTLYETFISLAISQSDHVHINTPGADMKLGFMLMDTYVELKERNQLELLKDLLSHEHDNVRRWAASSLLVVDEKLALQQLREIGRLPTYEGEKAREVVKDWGSGVSVFDF